MKFLCLYLLITFVMFKNVDSVNSTFHPTTEWQPIQNGQIIPSGLHVRMNLQTGQKEGKLLDSEKERSADKDLIQTEDGESLTPDELWTKLKNIENDAIMVQEGGGPDNYKSYGEIKQDLKAMNMQIKTDIEIMSGLIETFKKFDENQNSKSSDVDNFIDDELLAILVDLEYLVHQVDTAQEFAKLGGFTQIVHRSLNSTNGEIRSEALKLHGSATQNNPSVQIAALEAGSVHILLKTMTWDSDVTVRGRAIFALSCLLRRFPAAQVKLVQDGGLTAFALIFDKNSQGLFKLQVKIITLLHDLLFERKETKHLLYVQEKHNNITDEEIGDLEEKLRQYQIVGLEVKLFDDEWCRRISEWFVSHSQDRNNQDAKSDVTSAVSSNEPIRHQHDVIEKVVDTLFALSDLCKANFIHDSNLLSLLAELKQVYIDLAFKEKSHAGGSNFFEKISKIITMLTDKLISDQEVKDEL